MGQENYGKNSINGFGRVDRKRWFVGMSESYRIRTVGARHINDSFDPFGQAQGRLHSGKVRMIEY